MSRHFDITSEPRYGTFVNCSAHGRTDDVLTVHAKGRATRHVCRRCFVPACKVHGDDYTTFLNRTGVCVACDPEALMKAANVRRHPSWRYL